MPPLSRRSLLRCGAVGLLGANLRRAAAGPSEGAGGRAKSVIFLYQFGGPSHVDTFDMKPDAPEGIRSLYRPIDTVVPGVQICEHLPAMAQVMDRVTIVRTIHHTMKNHNSAAYYALTGRAPPVDDIRLKDSLELFPAYGSIVDQLAEAGPRQADHGRLPNFVSFPYIIRDGSVTPGQHASFLGGKYDPFRVVADPNSPDFELPELSLPENLSLERLGQRRALQQVIDGQLRGLEGTAPRDFDACYDKALGMLTSARLHDAFDLEREPAALREAYGRTTYGQSCLLARRLVESGVKFVNVYFSPNIGGQSPTEGGWDTHGFNNTRQYPILQAHHLPLTNRVLPVLLADLEDHGLLDETLVVWMGEFGRTPRINANISRDHWPSCYSVLLAGGGVRGGFVYGASDEEGAFPAQDDVPIERLAATIFAALGIDHAAEIHDRFHRPWPVAAQPPIDAVFG